jgi:hypothetical protein
VRGRSAAAEVATSTRGKKSGNADENSVGPPQTQVRPRGRGKCLNCEALFSDGVAFDLHVGAGRRCLTKRQMSAAGMVLVDGFWTTND